MTIEQSEKQDDPIYQANVEALSHPGQPVVIGSSTSLKTGNWLGRSIACSSPSSKLSTESYLQRKNENIRQHSSCRGFNLQNDVRGFSSCFKEESGLIDIMIIEGGAEPRTVFKYKA